MISWFICALLAISSLAYYFFTKGRSGFAGIIISILFAISLQTGYTIKPDRFFALAEKDGSHLFYDSQGNRSPNPCETRGAQVSCGVANAHIEFDKEKKTIAFNSRPIVSEDVHFNDYLKLYLVRVESRHFERAIVSVSIFSVLLLFTWIAGVFRGDYVLQAIFLESHAFWSGLGALEKTLLLLFPFIFILSTTGVDISAFNWIIRLNSSGVDPYFLQSIMRLGHWNAEFAPFPYPPFALAAFTPFVTFFAPVFDLLGSAVFGLDPRFTSPALIPLKITMYYMYICSGVIFAGNTRLSGFSARRLFYCYLLFPVSAYIAGFYGHIEPLTLCVFVVYLALLKNKDTIAPVMASIVLLLSCKLQVMVLLPILATPLLFVWTQRLVGGSYGTFLSWRSISFVTVFATAVYILPFLNKDLGVTLFQYPQNARIWYTVFQYGAGLYMYIAIFSLMCAFTAWSFVVERCENDDDIVAAVPVGVGVVAVWFSASIIFTHSFLSVAAPGFALILASPRISLIRKILVCGFSMGTLANLVFYDNGDISRILLQHTLFSGPKFPVFVSLTHTVAVSSLILLGVLLLVSSINILQKDGLGNNFPGSRSAQE